MAIKTARNDNSLIDTLGSKIDTTNYALRQTLDYKSSGTFVKADYPWLRALYVHVVGGGGGGGGAATTGAGEVSLGGGGGGGAYVVRFFTADNLAASETVTVGSGGSAGAPGVNNGGTGGTTTFTVNGFSSNLSANGGGGGPGAIAFAVPVSNRGGFGASTTTGGDRYAIAGTNGALNVTVSAGICWPGYGGFSAFGGPPIQDGTVTGSAGANATNYGAGGNGGLTAQNQGTARGGGVGGPGYVYLELYG